SSLSRGHLGLRSLDDVPQVIPRPGGGDVPGQALEAAAGSRSAGGSPRARREGCGGADPAPRPQLRGAPRTRRPGLVLGPSRPCARARVCREIPAEDRRPQQLRGPPRGQRKGTPGPAVGEGGAGEPPPGPRDPAPPPEAAPRGGGRTRRCGADRGARASARRQLLSPRPDGAGSGHHGAPLGLSPSRARPLAGAPAGRRATPGDSTEQTSPCSLSSLLWEEDRPAETSGMSCQSLLTFWNPLTTAQVTVESVPPNAAEGKDVLLRVHNLPGDTASLAWFRGETVAPVHQIVLYVVDTRVITPGPAYSGREIIYPSGSLLFQNITLNDTGSYILQIINRKFETALVRGQLRVFRGKERMVEDSLPGGQEARGARPPRILHPGPLSEEMMDHSSLTTPASCSSSGSLLSGWTRLCHVRGHCLMSLVIKQPGGATSPDCGGAEK
uniref:Immunoglobulin V-set domain-containing protein n=1 Tax=Canis lupus familiaris TaxID=9615 RepID=A0A8C0M6D3_CANLF